ncbi:hypothetical protein METBISCDRAFT_12380 [Metschnikowia bicuspidata]|uniref:Zn(2)-C6 fungal-type domain-containing protein n=1 Tax=Metschnikowia bicuspidata TaxID=27322 RepID=A0A4P9ZIL4_9ASCO|nr:hypothetical protein METBISCDRAFT_12380 [Metschnikowia bicuspidata]
MTVLENGTVKKLQKMRQRRILSCVHCHSKKIKCSRESPVCNNCNKLGIECKYFVNERLSKRLHRKQDALRHSFAKTGNQFFPSNISSPSSNMQQVLVPNLASNITNNFFNTNYATISSHVVTQALEDQFAFNLSSFTFAPATENMFARALKNNGSNGAFGKQPGYGHVRAELKCVSDVAEPGAGGTGAMHKSHTTNFVDGPVPGNLLTSNISVAQRKNAQPMTSGLHSSLNAYLSNPETSINYLYGTNTYYENETLLLDLVIHLPGSRERSFELIDRYVNSVHILLPILVNLPEFLQQHEIFWDHFDPYRAATPSLLLLLLLKHSAQDFNFLQFHTLYFPVLYASTMSEFEEYDNLLLNQEINKYLKGFNKICQYYKYPHGIKTIPLLLGNVIIQSTSPNPSTMEMSQIIRYAKFLQLHKDPTVSLRISDWKLVKFRRMLWWVIFGLDALTSHNFCLPPVCKFDDFNVVLPDDEDPVFDESGVLVKKRLNVAVLALTVKFKYDRILSELVYHLHNELATNITAAKISEIKDMIVHLFHYIHKSIIKMNAFYNVSPPSSVQKINLINFIKNHLWSFVDRALMLLHKKILLRDPEKSPGAQEAPTYEQCSKPPQNGVLSLGQYEDTFGRIPEANITKNFDNLSMSQLKFNQNELFAYENLHNNLIPSILHNLNDFLKYNDFIKFGKFNWYVKRTIPLDLIIFLFVIICVKFKYEVMAANELVLYVKLINKALFILNHKYFKNEKYKRMLLLTNLTWEYILTKHRVAKRIAQTGDREAAASVHFFDHQVSGGMNMSELFSVMDVPQPALITNSVNFGSVNQDSTHFHPDLMRWEAEGLDFESPGAKVARSDTPPLMHLLEERHDDDKQDYKLKVMQLSEKIYYDLRNNFVDINDYCTFYSSLENVLHELMDYIKKDG